MATDLLATHARVVAQVRRMAEMAEESWSLDVRAEKVSHWSVGEQIEHLAMSDLQVLGLLPKLLERPDRDAARRAHPVGRLMLALNWIPRGVGKAPEFARPEGLDAARLREQLAELLGALANLGDHLGELAGARGRFSHPRFGWLDLGQWLRFLEVHNHHHLKIVDDIRRATR